MKTILLSRSCSHLISAILALILICALSLVPAQQTQAAGTTYYVSKSGSDSNSGTQSSPWLTIQKAANTLQAGDTVQVRAGTYYERIRPARSGSSGAYITYRAYPGETAVIDGSGVSIDYYGLFGINDKQYIAVDGFEIRNAGSSGRVYPGVGVTGSGSAYITLKNLTIHNCANSGIMVDGANDFPSTSFIHNITIENCVIYHNNVYWGQESISLIAVDGFEIKNCKVYDAQGTQGGRDEIVEGIDCKEGTKNGSIHDCEVYDTLIGIYLDSGQTPQSNIKIYNNKIHDNIDDGIRLAAEGQASLTNISIYNNLIYNNQSRGFIVENYNFTVSFNFINNTLYNNNSAEIAVFNPDSKTTGVFRNNVVYATSEYAYILRYPSGGTHTTIDHNLFYDPHGYTGQSNTLGSNYVTANPSFVSTSGLDFRLQSTSPAINIGSSSGAPSTDYAGNTRPNGTAYDVGAYEYTGASSSGTLTLDTIGNKSITATQTLSFTISATNTAGGTLTYSASSLPSGATFTASTRTFTWTPTSSQAGTYSNIHFQVTNGTLTDSENITITVSAASTNHAPVLASIGGKSVSEGSALSFVVSATDADNDTLTYSASNLPSGASFSASTRTFSWTPGYSQSGAYSAVHFQVSDGKATDTEDITITVNNTNRAPVLAAIGNKSVNAGQALSFTISATDADSNTLTYSASNLPSGATFTASTRTFTWTPTSSQVGTFSGVRFQVSDGTATDYESITITVSATSTNQAPVLAAIGSKSVNEGSALSFTVSATDANGNTLTYSASNLPSGASFSASTRTFSWTPGYSQSGSYTNVHFEVTDGSLTDSENITITVNNTNRAPVLAAIGNKSVNAGQALSFTISATDADSNTLTYSASNLPSGATFTASTRTFTWTPTSSQVGTFSGVRFQVSDGTATDYENITITVNAASTPTPTPTPTPPPSGGGGGGGSPPSTDNAPVLAAIGSKSVNEGSVLSFTISATDADGDTLTYSASNLPSGANFNTSTRTFSWTPSYTQAGTYTSVHFQVSDGEKIDYENVSIIVADISTAPVIASIGNKLVTVGQTVKFTISATDAEGGTLTYTATNLPPGAKFDPATRTFTWTPTYEQVGTYYNVTFKVSDGANTSTATITIKVYKRRWYR